MLNILLGLSRRLFLLVLSLSGVIFGPLRKMTEGDAMMHGTVRDGRSKGVLQKEDRMLEQIFVAFGQGTGEIRVAREACLALHARALARLEAMAVNWDSDAVQVLERVRAMGRAARQLAVARFDTVVLAQDVEVVASNVMMVSETPICLGDPKTVEQPPVGIVVQPREVLIGKHAVSLPISREQLAASLGPPARTFDESGMLSRLLIWDSLGFVAYQSTVTDNVELLVFYIQPLRNRPFCPRVLAGSLTISNIKIDANSTLTSTGQDLVRQGARDVLRLPSGIWTLSYGSFHITLEQIVFPAIETVSIGLPAH